MKIDLVCSEKFSDFEKYPEHLNLDNLHESESSRALMLMVASGKDEDVRIFTTRDSLPDFIGLLIGVGFILSTDVHVTVLADEEKWNIKENPHYNEKGYLEDWPFGFFEGDFYKLVKEFKQ